jgi:hypothetical protein
MRTATKLAWLGVAGLGLTAVIVIGVQLPGLVEEKRYLRRDRVAGQEAFQIYEELTELNRGLSNKLRIVVWPRSGGVIVVQTTEENRHLSQALTNRIAGIGLRSAVWFCVNDTNIDYLRGEGVLIRPTRRGP